MTATTVDTGKIDIARVIQQLFTVLGRNFVTFLLLAFLLVGLPSGVMTYFQGSMTAAAGAGAVSNFGFGPGVIFSGLVVLVTSAILQGALIYGAVQDLNGKRASVGDSLGVGLRAFLPLIAVSILFALGVACGLVLLVVPGLMLLCAWIVAVPALVAERKGIFETFGRSAELTRGNRWRIFALLLLFWVASMVFGMIVMGVIGVGMMTQGAAGFVVSPLYVLMQVVVNTLSALVGATGAAVLYVELRQAREGLGAESLSTIFD
jgi:hypothetical protein